MLHIFETRLPSFFRIFFVLVQHQDGDMAPVRWERMLLHSLLDYLQIMRAVIHPEFGWSDSATNVVEKFDLLYWVTHLGSTVVPQYCFMVLAFLSVLVGILDALYVAKLLDGGNIQKAWPISVLRFMQQHVLATFLITTLRWLLIPMDCRVRDEYNFSEAVHGDGSECAPLNFPEVIASVACILAIVTGATMSWWTAYFSFQCNVLSRTAESTSTGRVEVLFMETKVLIVFLPFICQYVTATAVTVILFIYSFLLFYRHLQILPFHYQNSNILRGGIYASTTWSCLAGILVSVMESETLEWVYLTLVPLSALAGMALTHQTHGKYLKELDRIRGEWEEKQLQVGTTESDQGELKRAGSGGCEATRAKSAKQKTFEYFFDPSFERKRAFHNGQHALTCVRMQLYQQSKGDIEFLQALEDRALAEFPRFIDLQFFKLRMNVFIFAKQGEVAVQQKKLKANQEALALDLRFMLYSLERQGGSQAQTQGMGTGMDGQMSTMSLMEYRLGLKKAKADHLEAVASMKGFWYKASRIDAKTQIEDMVKYLENFQQAYLSAHKEYKILLYKYPTSTELLYSWSSFADSILNNPKEADLARKQAQGLQDDDADVPPEAALQVELEQAEARTAGSGGTSSSDNRRGVMIRQFANWKKAIMRDEERQLQSLATKVLVGLMIILAFATTGFVVSDFILFKSMAQKEMHMITTIGDMRTSCVSIAFYLRDLIIAAWFYDKGKYTTIQQQGRMLSEHISEENFFIRNHIAVAEADEYFNVKTFQANIPKAGRWDIVNNTLWELGNDFSRRSDLAFSTTYEELKSHSFHLANISDAKRGIPYVWENFFRSVTPAYEGLVSIYVHEMDHVGHITNMLVTVMSIVNGVLLLLLTAIVLLGMRRLIRDAEHKRVVCLLAISLPKPTVKKLSNFYRENEKRLRVLEDEDVERTMMETAVRDDDDTGHGKDDTAHSADAPQDNWHLGGSVREGKSKWRESNNGSSRMLSTNDTKSGVDDHRLSATQVFDDSHPVPSAPEKEPSVNLVVPHSTERADNEENGTSQLMSSSAQKPEVVATPVGPTFVGSYVFNTISLALGRGSVSTAERRSSERARRNSTLGMVGEFVLRDARHDQIVNAALDKSMAKRRIWFNRRTIYVLCSCILLVLGVMGSSFPSRNLTSLIHLAPIVDNAGRREELARGVIVFARELVMADGLCRHSIQELSNALRWLIDELKSVDNAIRLGDGHGIGVGADKRNKEHNEVMYTPICPWRDDPSDCTIPEKQAASGKGLQFLTLTFLDAAESVLARFGLPPKGHLEDFEHLREPGYDHNQPEFLDINVELTRYANFTNDADLKFVSESFHGDLFQGYKYIELMFEREMEVILHQGIEENDVLFSLYVVALLVVFYFSIFRQSIHRGLSEVEACRAVIMQIPTYVLSNIEGAVIQEHFVPPHENLDD